MALGSFANLEPYRLPASQNPLDVLIQGFQQGVALQQIPEQLRNARLNEALKQEIQGLNIQALRNQAIKDQYAIDNPNAKLMADLQMAMIEKPYGLERLDPSIGSLAQPGAINLTEDETLARIPIGPGFESDIPKAAPVGPTLEQIIASNGQATGFVQNPLLRSQQQQAEADAYLQKHPVTMVREQDAQGNVFLRPSRSVGGAPITAAPLNVEGGGQLKGAVKTSGALTETAKLTAFRKASEAGIDPDNPKYFNEETQSTDFTRLVVDTGKATRENKRLEDAAKASGLTGKSKTSLEELNAASKQLDSLNDEVLEIARSGKTPGFLDNMIAAEISFPASGGISAGWQQLLKGIQSDESKVLEDRKAVVASQLNKAVSGLATTLSEDRKTSYLPRPGDTFEDLIRKVSSLREYVDNQRRGLSEGSAPVVPTAPAPSGIQIRSIKRVQ